MVEAITGIVSKFGYFPNAKKFWLLAKHHFEDKECEILEHKHQHHNHLSILPGSTTGIRQSFQQTRVNNEIDQIEILALIAKCQPHVNCALIYGLQGKIDLCSQVKPIHL